MTPPKPSRRRLTEAEWEAELKRAQDVQAKGEKALAEATAVLAAYGKSLPLRTRTGRRRSWWQRGWKR